MSMSPLKLAAAAASLSALLTSGAMAAERDACNPDTFDDDLAVDIIRGQVTNWNPEFLLTINQDGWNAVNAEIDEFSNIADRDSERIVEDLQRAFKRGRLNQRAWDKAYEEASEKAPAIIPVLDELKGGEITAEALKDAWVKADEATAVYINSAKEYVVKIARGANPALEC